MGPLLAFSHSASVTVAEVSFLLLLIAGIWIAVAWLMEDRGGETRSWNLQKVRMVVAGVLIAGAGLLLIIATHWGHLFGQ